MHGTTVSYIAVFNRLVMTVFCDSLAFQKIIFLMKIDSVCIEEHRRKNAKSILHLMFAANECDIKLFS